MAPRNASRVSPLVFHARTNPAIRRRICSLAIDTSASRFADHTPGLNTVFVERLVRRDKPAER